MIQKQTCSLHVDCRDFVIQAIGLDREKLYKLVPIRNQNINFKFQPGPIALLR